MAQTHAGDPGDLLLAAFGRCRPRIDISGTVDVPDYAPADDADAMRADWSAVAADLSTAAKAAR